MPTKTYHRFWCKKCEEYTLQYQKECSICGLVTKSYKLIDVPNDKIAEQRERYRDSKFSFLSEFLKPKNPLEELFSEEPEIRIIECDAGQKQLDEIAAKKRQTWIEQDKAKKKLFNEKFKHLHRNDKCGCNSGKKYKKCCYSKFR